MPRLNELGRFYFPGGEEFSIKRKKEIENEIEDDFRFALIGIRKLPATSRLGVYLAYSYYYKLFRKIKGYSPDKILSGRIRIPNARKLSLMFNCFLKVKFNVL